MPQEDEQELVLMLAQELKRQDPSAVDLSVDQDWTQLHVFETIDLVDLARALLPAPCDSERG